MRFTTYAAASALAALSSAQTFTDCNPMKKTCPNDPAMAQTWETDFKQGKDAIKGWTQTAGSLTYGAEGAEFIVSKKGDAPTIGSIGYLHFGYVEVKMKAAPGQGIISSIVLQSDNLDEVDWEWIGGSDSKVQMNYFGKGNTTTYDRMIEAELASTQNDFHTYALNWTAESLTWIIDNKPIRTLNYADANGGKNFPQTPCNVRLGNWPGGDSENEGTRQWAGGKVDYTKAPFTMVVDSIKVINYSPGTEYHWTDKSGSFESIQVVDAGNASGAPQNTGVINANATAIATASGAPLESGFNAPTVTATQSGNCTENQQQTATPVSGAVSASGSARVSGPSDFDYPKGTPQTSGSLSKTASVPQSSGGTSNTPVGGVDGAEDTPCECGGVVTVTVTGAPPPATETPLASSVQVPILSSAQPVQSLVTSAVSPPFTSVVSPPVTSIVSPPFPSSGLLTDTSSPPAVPYPSAPTGVLPSGNATTSASTPEFTGAASLNKASVLISAIAGAVLLAF
ncbi:glycoside hydrolase family 16 protein [Dothidotthia symphoricarpi CBS 119687]|uniref:chitinase n=1 Tax=Dothidotthia symphoricarpi CBS 119687 TaxID=1392245 RepID=A0A6A5ZZ97_9PLEO|nr:glycoside hydrolase family 16 protein [Dothidotthia symphoricarpi CBS 119687]KAF2124203.1 glycoside hydrolase family 16 protein [Dothidotthia symphoricarpi CBS 119687]